VKTGPGVGRLDRARIRLEEEIEQVDDQDLQAERQEERREERRADHLVDEHPLDREPQAEEQDHRNGNREERIHLPELVHPVRQVGADHDEGAVRQVDDVHDAPDEREAQGHQRQDARKHQRVDRDLA
jgi:hypothetical protein